MEEACTAFEVSAFRYLLKPVEAQKFFEAMDLALKRKMERTGKFIKLNQGQKFLQLALSEILYFETVDRKLKVITTGKSYLVDNKINAIDKMLQEKDFFRVHKSYLINLAFVKEHDQSSITMQNNDIVYLSRLRIKAFKESFRAYLKEAYDERDN